MARIQTLLTFLLAGAFLGLATASWLGPKWLEYDNTATLAPTQTLCNLPEIIRATTTRLLHYQLVGTLTGAAAFLALGIVFLVVRSRRHPPASTPPLTPG